MVLRMVSLPIDRLLNHLHLLVPTSSCSESFLALRLQRKEWQILQQCSEMRFQLQIFLSTVVEKKHRLNGIFHIPRTKECTNVSDCRSNVPRDPDAEGNNITTYQDGTLVSAPDPQIFHHDSK